MRNRLFKSDAAFEVLEIADVLAQECGAAARQANRIFQFRPDAQNVQIPDFGLRIENR